MKALALILAVCAAMAVAGCGSDDDSSSGSDEANAPASTEASSTTVKKTNPSAKKTKPEVTVPDEDPPSELVTEDLEEGIGLTAEDGAEVIVHYVGVGYESGEEFDSSWDRGEPFTFRLGAGEVIPGWDQGIKGMKVGGRRELIIPADLAYGEAGFPPSIAPNEPLVFVIDLVKIY